jgi:hypothetical protein
VKKEEQVMMLGSSSIYVLVELSSGERGIIDINNFDKEIQEMWAPEVPIKALGLRKAACKQVLFKDKIYVTTDCMEKKFVIAQTVRKKKTTAQTREASLEASCRMATELS